TPRRVREVKSCPNGSYAPTTFDTVVYPGGVRHRHAALLQRRHHRVRHGGRRHEIASRLAFDTHGDGRADLLHRGRRLQRAERELQPDHHTALSGATGRGRRVVANLVTAGLSVGFAAVVIAAAGRGSGCSSPPYTDPATVTSGKPH